MWLNTAPDKAEGDKSTKATITRLKKMRDDVGDQDFVPIMPECRAAHLIEYLYEIGPVMAGGFAASAVTLLEIWSWSQLSGIDLRPWEARTIRLLSIAYCNEMQAARKHDAPAPWSEAPYVKPTAEVLLAKLKAAF